MFKILDMPTFTHEVSVQVPVDGGFEEQSFRARFAVTPARDDVYHQGFNVEKFLQEIFVGAEDIADANGKAMSWNDALRDQLITTPYVRLALLATYMKAVTKVREGN